MSPQALEAFLAQKSKWSSVCPNVSFGGGDVAAAEAEASKHITTAACTKMEALICRALVKGGSSAPQHILKYKNNFTMSTKQQADAWLPSKLKALISAAEST